MKNYNNKKKNNLNNSQKEEKKKTKRKTKKQENKLRNDTEVVADTRDENIIQALVLFYRFILHTIMNVKKKYQCQQKLFLSLVLYTTFFHPTYGCRALIKL